MNSLFGSINLKDEQEERKENIKYNRSNRKYHLDDGEKNGQLFGKL